MKVNCIYVEVFTLDSGVKSAVRENKKHEKHDELCSRKEFTPGMRKMIHRLVKVKREGSISK